MHGWYTGYSFMCCLSRLTQVRLIMDHGYSLRLSWRLQQTSMRRSRAGFSTFTTRYGHHHAQSSIMDSFLMHVAQHHVLTFFFSFIMNTYRPMESRLDLCTLEDHPCQLGLQTVAAPAASKNATRVFHLHCNMLPPPPHSPTCNIYFISTLYSVHQY